MSVWCVLPFLFGYVSVNESSDSVKAQRSQVSSQDHTEKLLSYLGSWPDLLMGRCDDFEICLVTHPIGRPSSADPPCYKGGGDGVSFKSRIQPFLPIGLAIVPACPLLTPSGSSLVLFIFPGAGGTEAQGDGAESRRQ